ncbi:MAG: hypothetical protein IPL12_21695 [Bacteroidetes bacterium]|nr:hypothetical protein [Bacteroidota bacterium]
MRGINTPDVGTPDPSVIVAVTVLSDVKQVPDNAVYVITGAFTSPAAVKLPASAPISTGVKPERV